MELPELPEPAAWLNMCDWSTNGGNTKADKPWACSFWNGPQKPEGHERNGYSWVAAFTENDLRAYAAAAVEAERERIRAAMLARHEQDKRVHNYWAFGAREFLGPKP